MNTVGGSEGVLCLDGLLRPIISSAGWLLVIQLFEKKPAVYFYFCRL